MAPGRWPIFPSSEWNRARRQGLITRINIGPMHHTSTGGYLDINTFLPDGTSYMDHTVRVVSEIVHHHTRPKTLDGKGSEWPGLTLGLPVQEASN